MMAVRASEDRVAKALEENLGWQNYKIVQDNASVFEAAETQRLMNQASEDVQTEAAVDPMGAPLDMEEGM